MTKTRFALFLFMLSSLSPLAASAQTNLNDNSQTSQRLDHIEHDLMLLQRQQAQGTSGGNASGALPAPGSVDMSGGSAQLEVRLSAMEETLRQLRGKIEENEFQMRQISENLDKLQRDNDYRFKQLSAAGAPTSAATPAATPQNPQTLVTAQMPTAGEAQAPSAPTGPTSAGDGVLRVPDTAGKEDPNSFSTPRELYNYAFRLLNQTQYEEAASAFDSFTKKYTKDPLVGNAFYWEGETYYIRRDYVKAADNFRQGFEALPDGPKAADNLLKLAMSLDALSRDKEACVVLGQIVTKFKASSTTVTEKADQEQKRIGCK